MFIGIFSTTLIDAFFADADLSAEHYEDAFSPRNDARNLLDVTFAIGREFITITETVKVTGVCIECGRLMLLPCFSREEEAREKFAASDTRP